jgi:endoglucanase
MNTSFLRLTALIAIIIVILSGSLRNAHAQYLHVQGKKIVDKNGNEVILHGMGLGGWMLQEGYMLQTGDFAGPQYKIREKIREVVGEENTQRFYDAWLKNHCTKRDIDSLAAWGFNSVRLPMHYNLYTLPIEKEPVAGEHTWLEKGFAMTDSLLAWCKANRMYLILDLHAAPGGQGKDANISDYDPTKPSLWESEENQKKTIALWRTLAQRYATEEWIGGYDLINEPNWAFTGTNQNGCDENNNGPLRKLMMEITAAIREVDKNHIIYIEGNCWGNNYNGIFPKWDNNTAASFHKYWNYTDQNSLQNILEIRDQQNMPIWLGETGENSNNWFTNTIRLLEDNKIGYAWWPMKKIGSVVNPTSVKLNDGYQTLLRYWKGEPGVSKPSVADANAALTQLTEDLKIENNNIHRDVIDAMFRQITSTETKPFKKHHIPGVIQACDYDLGRHNKAYYDVDSATYHVNTGTYTAWNTGWAYRNDGVDIQKSSDTDPTSNGFNIGWTNDKEWLQYTVTVDTSAAYTVKVRYAVANSTSRIRLSVNGKDITEAINLPSTGSNSTWSTFTIPDVILEKGTQKIRLHFDKGGANVGYLAFETSKKKVKRP